MKSKSVSYAKGFAIMGLVYSGCECVIEKRRARHDVWNAPLAGCAAGGIMATPGAFWGWSGCVFACFYCRLRPVRKRHASHLKTTLATQKTSAT
jgi:import inner membrane translocase subunit TIM22